MASRRLEEIELLALCMLSDNRDAFSRLVEMHQGALRRFLLNLTGGDESLTDDLAQDTFVKAWLAVRSFHGLSGFKTWLFRIAINEYSSWRRKMAGYDRMDVDISEMYVPVSVNPTSSTDARMDVSAALAQLSEKERMVSLLFYLEGMKSKEIAKVMQMPEGTVKSHLSRARNNLRKYFDLEL